MSRDRITFFKMNLFHDFFSTSFEVEWWNKNCNIHVNTSVFLRVGAGWNCFKKKFKDESLSFHITLTSDFSHHSSSFMEKLENPSRVWTKVTLRHSGTEVPQRHLLDSGYSAASSHLSLGGALFPLLRQRLILKLSTFILFDSHFPTLEQCAGKYQHICSAVLRKQHVTRAKLGHCVPQWGAWWFWS